MNPEEPLNRKMWEKKHSILLICSSWSLSTSVAEDLKFVQKVALDGRSHDRVHVQGSSSGEQEWDWDISWLLVQFYTCGLPSPLPACRSSSAHGHSGHQEPGDQQCPIPQLPQPPAAVPPQQHAEPRRTEPKGQEDQRQEEEADQGWHRHAQQLPVSHLSAKLLFMKRK